MSEQAQGGSPNVFPAFKYRDAHAAIDWLGSAFGFEKKLVIADEAGVVAHAELWYGPGTIMLGSERPPMGPDDHWASARFGTYVAVDDVDAHHARAKAAGAEIVRELADTDYGSREYSARDPEGNLWSFGTYRPGSHP